MQQWPQALIRWFPTGIGGVAAANSAINQQWIQTAVLSLLTILWASFSKGFTETLSKGAEERGSKSAEFLLKQFDNLVKAILRMRFVCRDLWVRFSFQGKYSSSQHY